MADTHDPRPEDPSVPEGNVWSVGDLNAEIGSVLDAAQDRLPSYVVGEVSDVNRYDFGTFLDLRDLDDDATISCIMWAHQREAIAHKLEEGTETIVRATVDFYHDDGRTQLAVKNFWPVGESDRSEGLAALRTELAEYCGRKSCLAAFQTVWLSLKYCRRIPVHMSDREDGITVPVTSKGQATIPKKFRDKLDIDTPGRVRFVETETGEIVVRPVKRPSEMRGALASEKSDQEKSATELLRDKRQQDKTATDKKHGLSEQTE